MRVLVTGGLGCIGSQIVISYLNAGHDISIIDSAEEIRNWWIHDRLLCQVNDRSRIRFSIGRLETFKQLDRELADIDAVIHAAASTGIPHSANHSDDDWRSNVDATKLLLDAIRDRPIPTVILSSVKPYKVNVDHLSGLRENDPLEPDEPYAASKAAQSMLAMAWARTYDLPIVTLRCSNLYGPAPCHGPRHGWLTWFCISAAIGRPLEVQGGGSQARDMLYSTDVVSACQLALANARTLQGKVFNIGGGAKNIISVRHAANRLMGKLFVDPIVTVTEAPGRRHEDQLVYVDHTNFTAATGWEPSVEVLDGMDQIYLWACEHRKDLLRMYEGV